MTEAGAQQYEGVPDDMLDMVVACPVEAGEDSGPQVLGEFLESELGSRILPKLVERIEKVGKLEEAGFDHDEAIDLALGGIVQTKEDGTIMRQHDLPDAIAEAQPQTAGAEKKSARN